MHPTGKFFVIPLVAGLSVAACTQWQAMAIESRALRAAGYRLFLAAGANPGQAQIYPDGAEARSDIQKALVQARREKKRVILDFGGNWCPDCHALEIYFHDPANLDLLNANYILVHINIGHKDQNQEIAKRYGVPIDKDQGVPALAVVSPSGKVLYSQRHGEFRAMRRLDSSSVTDFLRKWKP